jgi:hypothetical protein
MPIVRYHFCHFTPLKQQKIYADKEVISASISQALSARLRNRQRANKRHGTAQLKTGRMPFYASLALTVTFKKRCNKTLRNKEL